MFSNVHNYATLILTTCSNKFNHSRHNTQENRVGRGGGGIYGHLVNLHFDNE